jgi:hypothetical protein
MASYTNDGTKGSLMNWPLCARCFSLAEGWLIDDDAVVSEESVAANSRRKMILMRDVSSVQKPRVVDSHCLCQRCASAEIGDRSLAKFLQQGREWHAIGQDLQNLRENEH